MPVAEGVPPRQVDVDALRAIAQADVAAHVRTQAFRLLGDKNTPEQVVEAMIQPGALDLNEDALLRLQINVSAEINGLEAYHKERFEEAVEDVAGLLRGGLDSGDASDLVDAASTRTWASLANLPERARERFLQVGMMASVSESGFGAFGIADVDELIERTVSANLSVGEAIASDAVSRYIGEASEWRQENVGITHYIWQTRQDDRVRPTHQANEGERFPWAVAPETGPPGADFNCRCLSAPDISDELMESLQQGPEAFGTGIPEDDEGRSMKPKIPAYYSTPEYRRSHVRTRKDGSDMHVRSFGLELRQVPGEDDDGFVTLAGYGLKWDTPSQIYGEWEQFRRGAFAETLAEHRQYFLIEHNYDDIPLARTPDYMTVEEDDTGLRFEVRMSMVNPQAVAFVDAVARALIDKTSIGFSWNNDYEYDSEYGNGEGLVTYTRVSRLIEISGVKFPVHDSSEIAALSRPAPGDKVEASRARWAARLKSFRSYTEEA